MVGEIISESWATSIGIRSLRSKRPWRASAGLRSQRDAKHRRDNTDQGSQFTSAAFTGALAACIV
ncbi:hypothetical protein [Bradyrhizobium sp. USDA 10063]